MIRNIYGVTPAEFAVLFHVSDTVITDRQDLAAWVADHLPNCVPPDITSGDCLLAIDSLVRKGLLVELTQDDLEADLARWRSEPLPVSWGVDRDRYPGDIDVTEEGFRLCEEIVGATRPPFAGYNDETPGLLRIFGDSPESCLQAARKLIALEWLKDSVPLEPIAEMGPWWYSRFERIATGFEIRVVGGTSLREALDAN